MSKNLYLNPTWSSGTSYKKHDFVYQNSLYYYSLSDHTAGLSFTSDLLNGLWGGITIDSNGRSKPHFIWEPSYPLSLDHTPRVKSIRFGDGYEQRLQDGIHNQLLNIDVNFDNRSIDEYTAILHFLINRKGTEYFVFTLPSPYNINKRFVCRSWNDTYVAFNNNSIKTKFEEVPA